MLGNSIPLPPKSPRLLRHSRVHICLNCTSNLEPILLPIPLRKPRICHQTLHIPAVAALRHSPSTVSFTSTFAALITHSSIAVARLKVPEEALLGIWEPCCHEGMIFFCFLIWTKRKKPSWKEGWIVQAVETALKYYEISYEQAGTSMVPKRQASRTVHTHHNNSSQQGEELNVLVDQLHLSLHMI